MPLKVEFTITSIPPLVLIAPPYEPTAPLPLLSKVEFLTEVSELPLPIYTALPEVTALFLKVESSITSTLPLV